jgi:hypothetical protein
MTIGAAPIARRGSGGPDSSANLSPNMDHFLPDPRRGEAIIAARAG